MGNMALGRSKLPSPDGVQAGMGLTLGGEAEGPCYPQPAFPTILPTQCPATLASWLFLSHTEHSLTSVPLHLLSLELGRLFSQIPACLPPSLQSYFCPSVTSREAHSMNTLSKPKSCPVTVCLSHYNIKSLRIGPWSYSLLQLA